MNPRPPKPLSCAALAFVALAGAARAAEGDAAADSAPAAETAPQPPGEPAASPPPRRPDFEGAIGLVLDHAPTYPGAHDNKTSVIPGLFLRWGRISLSTNSGFVSRSKEDVERGLDATLVRSDRVRLGLTLRLERGRDAGSDPALTGVHEVRPTVRGRLSARWTPQPDWQLSAGASTDLLGRGGGTLVEVGASHEWQLAPRMAWSLGGGVAWGDARYMREHFGITPQDAAASAYPVYQPRSGLRDAGLSARIRFELGPRWIGYAGLSTSRKLGPARDSPLTFGTSSRSLNAGLAWRF